jgi:hypothetical protein
MMSYSITINATVNAVTHTQSAHTRRRCTARRQGKKLTACILINEGPPSQG